MGMQCNVVRAVQSSTLMTKIGSVQIIQSDCIEELGNVPYVEYCFAKG